MDTNKEDFDISRLRRFLWDSPNRIHNLIVTTLSILTLGMVVTIGFAMAQPNGFVQSFSETFSNIMGPVVGGVAAVFALLAFYVQYRANQEIRRQFNIQKLDNQFNVLLSSFHDLQKIYSIKMPDGNFVEGEVCLQYWLDELLTSRKVVMMYSCPHKLTSTGDVIPFTSGEPERYEVETFTIMGLLVPFVVPEKGVDFIDGIGLNRRRFEKIVASWRDLHTELRNSFSVNMNEAVVIDSTGRFQIRFRANHLPFSAYESSLYQSLVMLDNMLLLISNSIRTANEGDASYYERVFKAQVHGAIGAIYDCYLRSYYGKHIKEAGYADFFMIP